MSDFSTKPAGQARDSADASSNDEGGSPQRSEQNRSLTSFWARASRIWRPLQPSQLRKDLAEALTTDEFSNEVFSPEERAMLHNTLHFREVRVEDVMIPRSEIQAAEKDTTLGELMILFEETGHSRMPVYSETLDDPRGMVHIRDLLSLVTRQARTKHRPETTEGEAPVLDLARVDLGRTVEEAGIIRKVLFVPPSMPASDLLSRMQESRTQMALVIDEYGGTDGLVSHEDIVEMVIGDIEDEHDDEEALVLRVSDDVFDADARVELEEIAQAIGSDFDVREQVEDVDTLGGLIFSKLGRIPATGENVQALPGFDFHILDADPRRIVRVRITRNRAQDAADADDGPAAVPVGASDGGTGRSPNAT